MDEYAHAFCNSLGHREAYWELVDPLDSLRGGFIWEWSNQTLRADAVPGEAVMGDTADADGEPLWFDGDQFLLDGLVFSDLTPQPLLRQVKWT